MSLEPSDKSEMKSDLTLLYTLVLAFVQTGAAKSLIEAIRAALSGAQDRATRIILEINDTPIAIKSRHLTDDEARDLVARIEEELKKS
jgi:hypothetical protein